ncbi:cytochrome P450 9e2 [Plutella xylostella]|uniref:cytochrome P450 9e2 n=1 Tax=Plutella xylostella TaxID=51655 RepID=UPI002032D611|nr:cytochrome P450 9e2 [Plutella xylostella]
MQFLTSNPLVIFILQEWKLLSLLTIIFMLYFYYTKTFTFFEEKGVKFMKPYILLGNLGPRLMLKVSMHGFQLHIYNHFKGSPYGGIFEGRRPVFYVFDPDLIKAVTIKNFDHFVDRNVLNSRQPGYLSRSLINLKGRDWKDVRSTLTPSFSSTRLRNMLPLIEQCTTQMVQFLKAFDKKEVEMKDVMGHFTLEVIGACAFGIKCDALTDENAHFVQVASKFNDMAVSKRLLIFFVLIFMPRMFRFLNLSFLNPESTKELLKILTAAKAERRSTKSKRNDFLQLLIDSAEPEKTESVKPGEHKKHLDEDTIDAQALLFLIAGYETSSTVLSFAIHVMATHPELQRRLREHVSEVTDGKEMSYEVLAELHYLEAFLLETLRVYPPVSRIDRVVTKPYTVPGTSINLDPGTVVAIPVYGIHMDPDIYPEPTKIRPERFLGDEKNDRPSHLYLAFGAGPRNCIGLRFAMFSVKLAMVTLLKNYKFSPCSKTKDPIPFEKKGILLKAHGGVWVTLESLKE